MIVLIVRPAIFDRDVSALGEADGTKSRRKPSTKGAMLAAEAEGHEIRTIEGMAHGETLHPLQQKFLEHAALQCGICTSGMLVASEALLKKNPDPTEEEVRFWLAGNLCRCTGYDKIVRAVLDAAAEMRETAP